MVKFPSKGDITRIMNLNRWNFRDITIAADGWCYMAGRTSLEARSGIFWLKMEGIPLHLRFSSLFTKLGNYCGSFLDFNVDGCSWNSVRVKVKTSGVIPRQIPINLKGECFNVRVVVEDDHDLVEGWKGAGANVYARISDGKKGSGRPGNRVIGSDIEKAVQIRDSGVGKSVDWTEGDKMVKHTEGLRTADSEGVVFETIRGKKTVLELEEGMAEKHAKKRSENSLDWKTPLSIVGENEAVGIVETEEARREMPRDEGASEEDRAENTQDMHDFVFKILHGPILESLGPFSSGYCEA
ncbi:hypothetical protein LINGRAHAP2_LOCUS22517 [Linum grandiflorum]